MGILEIKNLSLELNGQPILKNLSIDIWEGHIHAIVGPNGAGKSTLAATIMGLAGYRHFSGDILMQNQSIKHLNIDKRAQKGITLGWQEPARFEGLLIEDFIDLNGKNTSSEILKSLGFEPEKYLKRPVDNTLSGGERKKIELASIMGMQPKIALLDEPDSGIDIDSIYKIFKAIKLLKENGTTVILITHSMEVLKQAEHAFLMCNGQLVDKGKTDKILYYFEHNCLPCDHQNVPDKIDGDENAK
jgi:Fe-S cluster assembly ATP-binding protein